MDKLKRWCIEAKTRANQKNDKWYYVMVCGAETFTILPQTLKYVYIRNSGIYRPITVSSIFTLSEPLCPVEQYRLIQQIDG